MLLVYLCVSFMRCLLSFSLPLGVGGLAAAFEGRMRDLIVSVPDHCLSFYFVTLAHPGLFIYMFYNT